MSVRHWNGTDSYLRVATVSGESNITSAFTLLSLIYPNEKDNWESLIAGRTVDSNPLWSFGMNPSNVPYFYKNTGNKLYLPDPSVEIINSTWWLIAYTIANAETDHGIFRIAEVGETPVHRAAETSPGPPSTLDPAVYLQMGATDGVDPYYGECYLHAIRDSFLSEADFNSIASTMQSSALVTAGFGGVWRFDQEDAADAVVDLAGNHADIVGSISGDDSNGFQNSTINSGLTGPWDEEPAGTPGLFLRKGGVWVPGIRRKRVGGEWV